jgi:hypothetical protein
MKNIIAIAGLTLLFGCNTYKPNFATHYFYQTTHVEKYINGKVIIAAPQTFNGEEGVMIGYDKVPGKGYEVLSFHPKDQESITIRRQDSQAAPTALDSVLRKIEKETIEKGSKEDRFE